MILNETYTLSNGVKIPILGFGTWFIDNQSVQQAVIDATEIGYRHIDTAQAYQNEHGVGEGIKTCGIKRNELFITTKLAAEVKDYKAAVASIDSSLQAMDLDYIDLMIIHSPKPWMEFHLDDHYTEGNLQAWKALEKAYQAGKIRAIGLSNFQITDLENIINGGTIKPMVNQILAHISNTPFELIEFGKKHQILTEAYSPIGHGELLKNEQLAQMAQQYGVSIPQLSIRYCLQLGLLPLPKTAKKTHMKNNAAVDFEISATDMEVLKSMERIKDYGEASMFPVYGGKLS
ncbi:aldo/keto reductase [bacterium]|nr:aldo/keto reductase [bacterium]